MGSGVDLSPKDRPQMLGFVLAFLFGIMLRLVTGIHGYSGQNVPPMYGDYEAQRHFMEVTYNLPISQWYSYDLQYWGLDYPPLTAYHSWIMGWISNRINPAWVALKDSRGFESPSHKHFMRMTSLVSDSLFYFVPCWFLIKTIKDKDVALKQLLVLLVNPLNIIIDHGHFQYNSVMLGLSLLAVYFISREKYILGSISFCLSLCYKQMSLYYSLGVFCYLLGICFNRGGNRGLNLFLKLGFTVLCTIGLIFLPFYLSDNSFEPVAQVLRRLFPFERGLYEDKVANFWCSLSIMIKLRSLMSLESLVRLSALVTLSSCSAALVSLFFYQTKKTLILGFSICSLCFYLFSFQVHEKSILLAGLPISLLYSSDSAFVEFFVNLAMFSMYPLLKKDGLSLAYFALIGMWSLCSGFKSINETTSQVSWRLSWFMKACYVSISMVHFFEFIFSPPKRFPDFYVMLNVLISCAGFLVSWLYLHACLYREINEIEDQKKSKME